MFAIVSRYASAFVMHDVTVLPTPIGCGFFDCMYNCTCTVGCCSSPTSSDFFSTFFKIGGCQRKSRIQILRKKIEV